MTMDPWGATETPSASGWHLNNPTIKKNLKKKPNLWAFPTVDGHIWNPRFEAALVEFTEKTDRDMA